MPDTQLVEEQLTHSVIGAFYDVYNTLGYGFLEQVYLAALERELLARGHAVGREVYVPVLYKGDEISRQRVDMIIDQRLVVEAKATRVAQVRQAAGVQLPARDSAPGRAPAALRT